MLQSAPAPRATTTTTTTTAKPTTWARATATWTRLVHPRRHAAETAAAVAAIEMEMGGGSKGTSGQREYLADEHLLTPVEVADRYGVDVDENDWERSRGLSRAEAAARLAHDGPNMLTPPRQTPEIVKFLKHFLDPFMVLLIVAGVLSCITYAIDSSQLLNVWLGLVLFGIVIFTCLLSYYQERQSSNVMRQIGRLLPAKCKVVRDGAELDLETSKLVVGDLVRFGLGDRIPADLRVVTCEAVKVECSSITGESEPIAASVVARSQRPVEAGNILFSSCLIHQGAGLGIVIRTGDRSFIGSIASLATATQNTVSTLHREIQRFVIFISVLSIVMAIIFFIVGVARGQDPLYTFVNGFLISTLPGRSMDADADADAGEAGWGGGSVGCEARQRAGCGQSVCANPVHPCALPSQLSSRTVRHDHDCVG